MNGVNSNCPIPAYIQDQTFHRAEQAHLTPPDIPDHPETERVLVGYRERGSDTPIVVLDEALSFALERTGINPADVDMKLFCAAENWGEDGKEYCDWFYSGNWDEIWEERVV